MTTRKRLQASQAQNRSVGPAVDRRSVAPVELEPHAGLGDPRPIRPRPAGPERRLRCVGPPGGSCARSRVRIPSPARRRSWTTSARTLPPERSTSSSIFAQERVDQHRPPDPGMRVAPVSRARHSRHGLGIAAGELGRGVGAAGEVEGLEDLHDLPVRLLHGPSGRVTALGVGTPQGHPAGDRDGRDWTVAWRSAVRPPGVQLSVSEEVRVRLRGICALSAVSSPAESAKTGVKEPSLTLVDPPLSDQRAV